MMKNILLIFFLFISYNVVAQNNPSGVPTQFSVGWFRQGWHQSDSGEIIAPRIPNFTPRFMGTTIIYPQAGVDTSLHYWTGGRWIKINPNGTDTTSLSNRINLKLNISDTTNKWWGIGKRWVDTVYRVNDSTIGFTINNGTQQTFQILGRSPSGGGGSGTVTSVGLSMPSAFSVTNSPITSSGTIAISGAGTSLDYIKGNGTLGVSDTSMIPNFYLKVRGLLSGTSPITFNQFTGAIGIPDANTTGTKGAATFNNSDFTTNGSGLISLRNPSGGSGVDTIYRTEGVDSIYYTIGGTTYAIKDSASASLLVNNGLSLNSDTIQLGQSVGAVGNPAALNHTIEIPLNGFGALFTGTGGIAIGTTVVGNRKLNISATSTTAGINITTVDATGINVTASGTGNALFAQSSGGGTSITGSNSGTSGYGVLATASSGTAVPLKANIFSSLTNSATPVAAEFVRNVFGIPADGVGLTLMFRDQTTNTTDVESGQIRNYFSTALHASRSSAFEFHLINNTVSGRKALLASTGQWTWDGYPALTAQTDTTTYKPIGIDGSGNVVKMAAWSGSGGGGGVPGGSNTQVQFNDGGAFGGDAGFTYNKSLNTATVDSIRFINARVNEDPFNADSVDFRGTSITVGVGATSGNRYSTITSYKLNALESNNGISGATLVNQGVANIWTLPIYNRAKYRWIILEWGVNDINSVTDSATFDNVYRDYIDTLIIARGWPSQRIVILAPSYIDPIEYPTSTLAKQKQFRDATYDISISKNTKWVDIYSAQLFRNPSNILVDGLHPNDYGAYVYVNAITNTIGDSVMSTNQNLSINGITEFQRLKLRSVDTATYKTAVIGMDSVGNIARFTKDQIIQNSTTLPTPQASSISLVGRGYFGNVTAPTAAEVVQVNGMVKGTSLRATGSSPMGLTGAGMELSYIGGIGFLFAYDRDGSTGQQLAMNSLGGAVTIGTSSTPNGTELLYAPVASKFKSGQFNGTIQGGLKDSAVEIGLLNSTIGYIGAYNRTTGSNMRLSINALGGSVMVGGFTDDAIGALQVKGKLTITTIDSAATPLNMLFADPTTGEVRKSAVPSGGTTIYTGDGTLAGNRTVTGSNNSLTFNTISNYRINGHTLILDQQATGFPYTASVVAVNPHNYQLGYTSSATPTVYTKGAGLYIDTNNNAGLGASIPTTLPLYTIGNSAYAVGFQSGGGNFYGVAAKTANYTVATTDNFITIDATGGNVTLTLPAASTCFGGNVGIDYVFKRLDNSGNTITVQRAGSDTIDGATSFTLTTQWEAKKLRCLSTSTWGVY